MAWLFGVEYCDRELTKADLEMVIKLDPLRAYPQRYHATVSMDDQKEKRARVTQFGAGPALGFQIRDGLIFLSGNRVWGLNRNRLRDGVVL